MRGRWECWEIFQIVPWNVMEIQIDSAKRHENENVDLVSRYLYSMHADNILLDRKFCNKIYKFNRQNLTHNRFYILAIPIHVPRLQTIDFLAVLFIILFHRDRNRWRSKTSYKIVMKRKRRFIVTELMMNLIPQVKLINRQSLVGTISVHSMHSLCTLENFFF